MPKAGVILEAEGLSIAFSAKGGRTQVLDDLDSPIDRRGVEAISDCRNRSPWAIRPEWEEERCDLRLQSVPTHRPARHPRGKPMGFHRMS